MRLKLLLLACAVLVTGTAYLVFGKTGVSKTTTPLGDLHWATASKSTIVKTMRLAGQTSARDFVNINAPILRGPEGGKALVLMKLAKAGAYVKQGDMVATLDAQQTIDHVDDVADTVRQAEADIRKRKAEQEIEWQTLEQTLRQAKSDMEKAKLDARTTALLTDIERELLQLNVEETEARYRQLQKNLAFQKTAYEAEIRILDFTRERQQRHHDRHARDVKTFTIGAPLNGLAVMQQIWRGGELGQVQEGDQVYPGQLFMKVVNPASMQVEAKANQAESSLLRVGQKVTVHLDAFPGTSLAGHVYSIGALAVGGWVQNAWVRSVPVNILIDSADRRLIPDLSASGDVVIDTASNVVAVPVAAIRESNGKQTVLVKRGSGVEERAVSVGLANAEQAAVLSGLQAGEEVRLN